MGRGGRRILSVRLARAKSVRPYLRNKNVKELKAWLK
jgi:hypothetical protein